MAKGLTCNIGDTFGLFEVIDNTPIIKYGHRHVKVKCTNCGSEQLKTISDLHRGNALGCKKCMGKRKQLNPKIGETYGKWTIVDGPFTDIRKNTRLWKCKCSCGNEGYASSHELLTGKSIQCKKCSGKQLSVKMKKKNGTVGELDKTRYGKLRKNAETRKIEFEVSMEYLWDLFVSQNNICAITGDHLASINDASLDRIDSSKGYIEGNVQWVTKQANLSKHVMSMEQLYEFCRKVLNHANQQPSTPLTKCEGSETNDWNS